MNGRYSATERCGEDGSTGSPGQQLLEEEAAGVCATTISALRPERNLKSVTSNLLPASQAAETWAAQSLELSQPLLAGSVPHRSLTL